MEYDAKAADQLMTDEHTEWVDEIGQILSLTFGPNLLNVVLCLLPH